MCKPSANYACAVPLIDGGWAISSRATSGRPHTIESLTRASYSSRWHAGVDTRALRCDFIPRYTEQADPVEVSRAVYLVFAPYLSNAVLLRNSPFSEALSRSVSLFCCLVAWPDRRTCACAPRFKSSRDRTRTETNCSAPRAVVQSAKQFALAESVSCVQWLCKCRC